MAEIDDQAKMYYILGMGNPMEQYKKKEGGIEMPEIDFKALANSIAERIDSKKEGLTEAFYDVLRERGIRAKSWPDIIDKTREIMIKERPDLFPKSWVNRRKSTSFKITAQVADDARKRDFYHSKRAPD